MLFLLNIFRIKNLHPLPQQLSNRQTLCKANATVLMNTYAMCDATAMGVLDNAESPEMTCKRIKFHNCTALGEAGWSLMGMLQLPVPLVAYSLRFAFLPRKRVRPIRME